MATLAEKMRTVFAHLKNVERSAVVAELDNICDKRNVQLDQWLCLKNGDPVLYVSFYKDYQELEPDEWNQLIKRLGCEPSISIVADVSGRHDGRAESISFLRSVLSSFDGVVQDDSQHVWTIQEILNDGQQEEHRFFAY
jgi:hypothetical protein